jgi:hypothetical protein
VIAEKPARHPGQFWLQNFSHKIRKLQPVEQAPVLICSAVNSEPATVDLGRVSRASPVGAATTAVNELETASPHGRVAAICQNFMVVRIPITSAFGIGDVLSGLSGLEILPPG